MYMVEPNTNKAMGGFMVNADNQILYELERKFHLLSVDDLCLMNLMNKKTHQSWGFLDPY